MWQDELKNAGVNIHVIATGAGAGLQERLWEVPGSSSYLGGASFPYAPEEQEELLGFMPEHFCSEENSIDLASAAYMKAYKFGGKKPVGIGLTASVASEKLHRGDHRIFVTVITDDKVLTYQETLDKGVGSHKRFLDGKACGSAGFCLLLDSLELNLAEKSAEWLLPVHKENSKLALERFFMRPFFMSNGKRLNTISKDDRYALMSGAYNPPHEGHFGIAKAVMDEYNYRTVFEVTATPPHKDSLTIQTLLQRAKLLKGHDTLFTKELPFYLDKAKAFPGKPLVMGADAMVRMLDPKWGLDIYEMLNAFYDLDTKLFICSREVDGVMTSCEDILTNIKANNPFKVWASARTVMMPLDGEWNISSTELRKKLI